MLWGFFSFSSSDSSLLRNRQLDATLTAVAPACILLAVVIRMKESPLTSRGKKCFCYAMQITSQSCSISAAFLVSFPIDL